jgi:hypothetical protein
MSTHETEQERFRRELTKRLARIAFYNETLCGVHVDAEGSREWHVIWDLIHEHDDVVAVWRDPSSLDQFDLMPIKGAMPNSNKELRALKMTAIACNNRDQAIGLSIMYQARDHEGLRSAVPRASRPCIAGPMGRDGINKNSPRV